MNILVTAWENVTTATVISCLKKARILLEFQEAAQNGHNEPFIEVEEQIDALRQRSPELVDDITNADDFIETDKNIMMMIAKQILIYPPNLRKSTKFATY